MWGGRNVLVPDKLFEVDLDASGNGSHRRIGRPVAERVLKMRGRLFQQKEDGGNHEEQRNLKITLDTAERNRKSDDKKIYEEMKEQPVGLGKNGILDPLSHTHAVRQVYLDVVQMNLAEDIQIAVAPQISNMRTVQLQDGQRLIRMRSDPLQFLGVHVLFEIAHGIQAAQRLTETEAPADLAKSDPAHILFTTQRQERLKLDDKTSAIVYNTSPYLARFPPAVIRLVELERQNHGYRCTEKGRNRYRHGRNIIPEHIGDVVGDNPDEKDEIYLGLYFSQYV